MRFAQVFPTHPDGAGVLTRATEELYQARNLPRALEVAGLLLARSPPATPAQRRIAYSVTGQAQFDQGQFAAAESAWTAARVRWPPATGNCRAPSPNSCRWRCTARRRPSAPRVMIAARWMNSCGWRAWRLARPPSKPRSYDAAAELIKLADWPRAIDVLESYRRDYPKSTRQSDITQKLAVAYTQAGRGTAAAAEYERIAASQDQPAEVRLEALGLAAEQYEKSGDTARAVALLEKLVAQYPHAAGRAHRDAPEAGRLRGRRPATRSAWPTGRSEIVKADAAAGAARTDRTRFLAAKASLALAAPERERFRALKLTAPLDKSLATKRSALEAALAAYKTRGGLQHRRSGHPGQLRDRRAVPPAGRRPDGLRAAEEDVGRRARAVRPAAGRTGHAHRGAGHRAA